MWVHYVCDACIHVLLIYIDTNTKVNRITCLCICPPVIDIIEDLTPNTGFTNFINIGMLRSLVLIWNGVLNTTASHRDSERGVLNVTVGLRESEGHIFMYQEEIPYK